VIRPDKHSNDPVKWYAVYVRSRHEKKVHAQLVRKGVETYLPLIEEFRVWSDRKKKVQEPLFRGYLFVRISLKHKLDVLQSDGVVRLVGTPEYPSPVREEEIDWIKRSLGDPSIAKSLRMEKYPLPGKKVEVISGPLRGIRGVVAQVRGNARLVIQVEAISRAFSVEVSPEFLVEAR